MNKKLKIRWNHIDIVKPKQGEKILLFTGNFFLPQPYPSLISGTYEIDDGDEYYDTEYGYQNIGDYPHWTEVYQLNLPQSDEYYTYFVYRGYDIYDICYSSTKLERTAEDTGQDGIGYDTEVELIIKNSNGSRLITPIHDVFKTQQPNMKKLNYE
jgi:hypothetical protein